MYHKSKLLINVHRPRKRERELLFKNQSSFQGNAGSNAVGIFIPLPSHSRVPPRRRGSGAQSFSGGKERLFPLPFHLLLTNEGGSRATACRSRPALPPLRCHTDVDAQAAGPREEGDPPPVSPRMSAQMHPIPSSRRRAEKRSE